jgi:hypothetical protein
VIYYSYHEELQLLQPHHHIHFYRHLIDDALVIQTGEPGSYGRFIQDMNSNTVAFLDLTILLQPGYIETRTYQKAMN